MTDPLRETIVEYGRSLHERGLSPGTSGNLSVRLVDGFLCTPTNASLGSLAADRLSLLDASGAHVEGDAPTKEAPLHLALYDAHSDARAVVHLHSTYAVAASCLADADPADALPALTPYYVMRVGRLPLVPFRWPGSSELVEEVRARAAESRALLLANHGPIVAAASLADAVAAAEEIEEAAKIALLLRGLPVRELPQRD
ncbi:MAG TPA: 3-oxo-tetronate 4-phosphate decarboxylase [Gaiellaceae bacterium]|nr:3-oxo-tetronate 4-phosphate decarboxylase [Gaiellaceae bacterium]